MMKIYKTIENSIKEISELEQGSWINLVSPTKDEIDFVSQSLEIPKEFLTAALDMYEKPRIEVEDDIKLIIIDFPTIDIDRPEYEGYSTLPLAFVLTKKAIVTICTYETSVLSAIYNGQVKTFQTNYKNRFILRVLLRVAQRFLIYLAKIEKTSDKIEKQLNKTLKNEELLQLLALSKSLIYFKASLKANEAILRKILRGHILKLYEEDEDLLEDALIEIAQAADMASSYAEIINATMETYSSVTSNNLNIIMKFLAAITIILTIPTMVFGYYGMNIDNLAFVELSWFPLLSSTIGCLILLVFLKIAKFF